MGQTVTTRLSDDLIKKIEEISKIERLDKSSTIRRLLDIGIKSWFIDKALNLYQNRKISFGKAVELSSLSSWEFLDLLAKKKIPIDYDIEEFKKDLALINEGDV